MSEVEQLRIRCANLEKSYREAYPYTVRIAREPLEKQLAEKDKLIIAIEDALNNVTADRDALDNGNIALNEKLTAAHSRIEKLRGALEFYAKTESWNCDESYEKESV